MIAQILGVTYDATYETAFPAGIALKGLTEEEVATAFVANFIGGIKIPRTYKEATENNAHAKQWRAAMAEEFLAPHTNGTFQEVVPPRGANIVSCKWVYTIKLKVDGSIERLKARLVARGFSQVYGQDSDRTFAPTVRMDMLRLFLAVTAQEEDECHQYDIKNAFTESELKDDIYLKAPEGVSIKRAYFAVSPSPFEYQGAYTQGLQTDRSPEGL
ncbi:uncharacterized protein CPUR_01694 [Claviceps purpurea 20.1]|uniref:Reverse transcriptase Ty1/copia-type domain-containing protein n=1 Tax=Claviceps purpurea (strain 20.1) TaxID=1111077 RepID=M1W357_CLAP2|nr:uncharacterized protein CPUR_01694 [Claviceps purpurea 20.1]